MYKVATLTAVATVAVAAAYFQTLETPGLFAIAWIGGLAFAVALTVAKSFGMKS